MGTESVGWGVADGLITGVVAAPVGAVKVGLGFIVGAGLSLGVGLGLKVGLGLTVGDGLTVGTKVAEGVAEKAGTLLSPTA